MATDKWGPPTWRFIHTLVAQLRDESYRVIGGELVQWLVEITRHLPCPECTQHAFRFWQNVKLAGLKSRTDVENLMFMFHNMVNFRKHTQLFRREQLKEYQHVSLVDAYNQFARHFNTRGNMSMINESFHRDRMLKKFRQWLMQNIYAQHFWTPTERQIKEQEQKQPPNSKNEHKHEHEHEHEQKQGLSHTEQDSRSTNAFLSVKEEANEDEEADEEVDEDEEAEEVEAEEADEAEAKAEVADEAELETMAEEKVDVSVEVAVEETERETERKDNIQMQTEGVHIDVIPEGPVLKQVQECVPVASAFVEQVANNKQGKRQRKKK